MTKEVRQTVTELTIGIIVHAVLALVIALVVGWFICKSYSYSWGFRMVLSIILGVICGAALAEFMAVHMARSLDKSMDMDERGALNHTRKMYVIRTIIVLTAVVLIYATGFVNILCILFGLFGLKSAAYTQPLIHRIIIGPEEEAVSPVSSPEEEGE